MNMEYISVSQFKDFAQCEVHALAKLKGEYVEEKTDALLIGSYVDAYFSNELETFIEQTPELLDRRMKVPTIRKALVEEANKIIKAIESDELLMKYLGGKKQVVMTGTINGVKVKIKIDSLLPYAIVDQKIMSSIKELIWVYDQDTKRNKQVDFIEAFGYDLQGAVYQEIARQNLGVKLPFILAPTTKEEEPDKALIQIDQDILDKKLEYFASKVQRYDLIKKGIIDPIGCGNCPSCRKKKKLTEVVSYKALFGKEDNNEEEIN